MLAFCGVFGALNGSSQLVPAGINSQGRARFVETSERRFETRKSAFAGFDRDLARRFMAKAMSGLRGTNN